MDIRKRSTLGITRNKRIDPNKIIAFVVYLRYILAQYLVEILSLNFIIDFKNKIVPNEYQLLNVSFKSDYSKSNTKISKV